MDNASPAEINNELLTALEELVKWLDDSGLSKTEPGGHGALTYEATEYSVVTDARTAIEKAYRSAQVARLKRAEIRSRRDPNSYPIAGKKP